MTYVDTNILIYLLEQHFMYSELVAEVLDEVTRDKGILITSVIAITEFLAGTDSSSLETLQRIPQLSFIPLNENLAEQAVHLQRKNNLQIGDAIHLATALEQRADALFTNDKLLAKIAKSHITVRELRS